MKNKIFVWCVFFVIVLIMVFFVLKNNGKSFGAGTDNKYKLKAMKFDNNPILEGENNHIAGNCLIKDNKGNILLYFYQNSNKGSTIGLAKSGSGLRFKKLKQPVLFPGEKDEWDSGGVSIYPSSIIQRNDGTYWMYYTGHKKNTPDFYWKRSGGIGLAFSKDLVNWTKFEKNPILVGDPKIEWESEGVFEPSVIFTGDEFGGVGAFKMWYGGNNKEGVMSIGYAESIEGSRWVKHKQNPVLIPSKRTFDSDAYTIEVHNVIRFNNQYIMAYEGTDRKFPSRFSIGLAYSKDGIKWMKSFINPILEGGCTGDWDSMGTYHPSIIMEKNKLLMFYVGLDYAYSHRIGVAEINPYYFNLNYGKYE